MQWLDSAEITEGKGQIMEPAPQDAPASRVLRVILSPASSRPGETGGLVVGAFPDPNELRL